MSKVGKRLIASAKQAAAIARSHTKSMHFYEHQKNDIQTTETKTQFMEEKETIAKQPLLNIDKNKC